MIVRLLFINDMPVTIALSSSVGSPQPLVPGQSLDMMFELQADDDGVTELELGVCPASERV